MEARRNERKIFKIGDQYFRGRYQDSGFQHPEDKGLWRCNLVTWDWKKGKWDCNDDDDWMISEDGTEVIAREVGWDLRRYVNGTYHFKHCV